MGDQLALVALETEADRRALEGDHKQREDDPTPRLLVRAGLAEVLPRVFLQSPGGWAPRVLGVGSGYGCWESEIRRWAVGRLGGIHITGVEICAARRPHLEKWCDRVETCSWDDDRVLRQVIHDTEPPVTARAQYHLAIGNPHFTGIVTEDPAQSMPAVLLRSAQYVVIYHTLNTFVRSAEGREVWRRYPPSETWLVPGTVSHDGTSSVASDCYQITLWKRCSFGPTVVRLLDAEPGEANRAAGLTKRGGDPYLCWRWRGQPPGSEDPSEDLPAAPGWAP